LLELDYKGRFNIPGTSENNWIWRLDNFDSLKNVTNVLKELNHSTSRN
jgi:4-alpha-glucanotransferase